MDYFSLGRPPFPMASIPPVIIEEEEDHRTSNNYFGMNNFTAVSNNNPGSDSSNSSSSGGSSLTASASNDKKAAAEANPLISDTEKCKVCGEAAARHIHYGATTCFSCRAFFRRSIQNQSTKQYICRKGGNCMINLKTRKNCQKCRFDKCLNAGMKSSWVLSEEERFRR